MRRLYTLAYPTLTTPDKKLIDAFRVQHDLRSAGMVEAHFTMVFGATVIDTWRYIDHIKGIAGTVPPIQFHCRYAMLGADDIDETAYVFLVPDEGYSKLSLLHDRLYSGLLAPLLRLDLQYVPHITIGTCPVRHEAKRLCDDLNARGVSIAGKVETLTVAAMVDGKIENLEEFRLGTG